MRRLSKILHTVISVQGIITKPNLPAPKPTVPQQFVRTGRDGFNERNNQELPLDVKTRKTNDTHKSQSWHSILKDATFQSLIKYTGFTPSLEEKLESDRILWEKIHAAKFFKKPAGISEDGRLKMGILVDMTSNGGNLEFRQSDQSVYTCPDQKCDQLLQRLLAIWKIERFEPNDSWIHIKVPRYETEEDVYEFTPKTGLQQINTRFSKATNKTAQGNKIPKVDHETETTTTKESPLDERFLNVRRQMDLTEVNLDSNPIMEDTFPTPFKTPKSIRFPSTSTNYDDQWTSAGTPVHLSRFHRGYSLDHNINALSKEAKIEKEFKNNDLYNGFLPSMGPTGSPFTTSVNYFLQLQDEDAILKNYNSKVKRIPVQGQKEFKSSPNFVQYSELDPVYHNQRGSAFVYRETTTPPELFGIIANDETSDNNEYLKNLGNTTSYELEEPDSEQTDGSIKISRFTDSKGNRIDVIRTNHKKSLATPTASKDAKDEVLKYAPLYTGWGDKIKPLKQSSKSPTTTPSVSSDKPKLKTEFQTTEKANMIIENIENKTPEEVVGTLTNIGINNSTLIEENHFQTEREIESTSTESPEQTTNSTDQDSSMSLIINRTSQSFSYKTAGGKLKYFKKKRTLNETR